MTAPPSQRPGNPGIDHALVVGIVEPVVRAHGAELVDVEWKTEGHGWVLRVLIEKLGSLEKKAPTEQAGVDLETCSNIAKDLSPALDVNDPIPHRYSLEVGSPGVERALRKASDFARFESKKAKLKLHVAQSGQKVLVGLLGPLVDSKVTLVVDEKTFHIPLSEIASARLVFEFGPAPKPGTKPGTKPGPKPGPKPGKKNRK